MNAKVDAEEKGETRNGLRVVGGKLYFSRQMERKFYFALTMAMLLTGIGYRVLGG